MHTSTVEGIRTHVLCDANHVRDVMSRSHDPMKMCAGFWKERLILGWQIPRLRISRQLVPRPNDVQVPGSRRATASDRRYMDARTTILLMKLCTILPGSCEHDRTNPVVSPVLVHLNSFVFRHCCGRTLVYRGSFRQYICLLPAALVHPFSPACSSVATTPLSGPPWLTGSELITTQQCRSRRRGEEGSIGHRGPVIECRML